MCSSDLGIQELTDMALECLSRIFKTGKEALAQEVIVAEVVNWHSDQFTRGAYSYPTVDTKDAPERLVGSCGDGVFFAGEALYSGQATATVEGALGSGIEVARRMLECKA